MDKGVRSSVSTKGVENKVEDRDVFRLMQKHMLRSWGSQQGNERERRLRHSCRCYILKKTDRLCSTDRLPENRVSRLKRYL